MAFPREAAVLTDAPRVPLHCPDSPPVSKQPGCPRFFAGLQVFPARSSRSDQGILKAATIFFRFLHTDPQNLSHRTGRVIEKNTPLDIPALTTLKKIMQQFSAHSANEQEKRHELSDHLHAVAQQAQAFGAGFEADTLCYYLGLWHDLGKYTCAFQQYLQNCEEDPEKKGRGPDHKAPGTVLAEQYGGPLAFCIQGHHGGLRNKQELKAYLKKHQTADRTQEALAAARQQITGLEPERSLSFPAWVEKDPLAAEFFLRMAFSALIDADFLDTEAHFAPDKTGLRTTLLADMHELCSRFDASHAEILRTRPGEPADTIRASVYEACREKAAHAQGLFRLTVPTGGGKTLSSLAFALQHARTHGLQRVIVAIPHISITQQTAGVFRRVLEEKGSGAPVVLEHHSSANVSASAENRENSAHEGENFERTAVWSRLSAENWDAPVIVTTTVQLFESLFSNKISRTRKLHNLTNSVIILDETQALPYHLLEPILDGLVQLSTHYGTTVVFSTATQPAFESIKAFRDLRTEEIAPNPPDLFRRLRRVEYEWKLDPQLSWKDVATQACSHRQSLSPQSLSVVNTKKDALNLYKEVAKKDPSALFLSTLLCGAHRSDVLREVRRRLDAHEPCMLVSTQVVEAGVDLDFPIVLRAMGPLDSIIQAAGRCNRGGKLDQPGQVVVFDPAEGSFPPGTYRIAWQNTLPLIRNGESQGSDPDLHDPEIYRAFYKCVFDSVETDKKDIQKYRKELDFPHVARTFRMIEQDSMPVVVPYGSESQQSACKEWVGMLRKGVPTGRSIVRELQPYTVSLYWDALKNAADRGIVHPVTDYLYEWQGPYDPQTGLILDDTADPGTFVL